MDVVVESLRSLFRCSCAVAGVVMVMYGKNDGLRGSSNVWHEQCGRWGIGWSRDEGEWG